MDSSPVEYMLSRELMILGMASIFSNSSRVSAAMKVLLKEEKI